MRVNPVSRYWRVIARALQLPPAHYPTAVERNIPVEMYDGAILMADHYYPTGEGTFPTVLIRSPYGRGSDMYWPLHIPFSMIGRRIAERGYHLIIQTTRGRNDSGGTFSPGEHEGEDGQAVLSWISSQEWFDGSVGMMGTSYMGFAQWAIAVRDNKYIKAIVPAATASHLGAMVFLDGAVALDTTLRWLLLADALEKYRKKAVIETLRSFVPWLHRRTLARAFHHLPLAQAGAHVLGKIPSYSEPWLKATGSHDLPLRALDHSGGVANVTIPVHLVSGWYDFFLRDTLKDYIALGDAGRLPYLTIGPWKHSSPLLGLCAFREALRWFEVHLKGNQEFLREHPVRLFVMGGKYWADLPAWPPPSREERFFLQPQGQLNSCPRVNAEPEVYYYDPANPTPSVGGASAGRNPARVDNRALEARSDVLCFTTPALTEDMEVIGTPRATLYVRSSCAHTDFFVRLCDVYPNGKSLNVCDGLLRVSPGIGERQPDGSLRIEVPMWPTANVFKKGHRIRLQVSSGAHPRWSRNLGTGEPILSGTLMVKAEQTVFQDSSRPSALILPVTRRGLFIPGAKQLPVG